MRRSARAAAGCEDCRLASRYGRPCSNTCACPWPAVETALRARFSTSSEVLPRCNACPHVLTTADVSARREGFVEMRTVLRVLGWVVAVVSGTLLLAGAALAGLRGASFHELLWQWSIAEWSVGWAFAAVGAILTTRREHRLGAARGRRRDEHPVGLPGASARDLRVEVLWAGCCRHAGDRRRVDDDPGWAGQAPGADRGRLLLATSARSGHAIAVAGRRLRRPRLGVAVLEALVEGAGVTKVADRFGVAGRTPGTH